MIVKCYYCGKFMSREDQDESLGYGAHSSCWRNANEGIKQGIATRASESVFNQKELDRVKNTVDRGASTLEKGYRVKRRLRDCLGFVILVLSLAAFMVIVINWVEVLNDANNRRISTAPYSERGVMNSQEGQN